VWGRSGADGEQPPLAADALEPVAQGGGAADPPAGPVEQGQDAVAGRLDQPPAELGDQLAGDPVAGVEQLGPAVSTIVACSPSGISSSMM
jgi:hypothetical protein